MNASALRRVLMWFSNSKTVAATSGDLAEEIAATLRGIIQIQPLQSGSVVGNPTFWRRCRVLRPGPDNSSSGRIYVDGFGNACKWNSCKVFTDALEQGLSIWSGYAMWREWWMEHTWCMLGDRIVETTAPFRIYFGAALKAHEREQFIRAHGCNNPSKRENAHVATLVCGQRDLVPYDPNVYSISIGRERDHTTRTIKEGLGR